MRSGTGKTGAEETYVNVTPVSLIQALISARCSVILSRIISHPLLLTTSIHLVAMMNLAVALLVVVYCAARPEEGSSLTCPSHRDKIYGGVEVVCSAMNLTHFPKLPHNVTTLKCDRNKIQNLMTGDFLLLTNLHYLDLSVNSISDIERDAFKGLSRLEILRLDGNKNFTADREYAVFAHLSLLKVLFVNNTGVSVSKGQISRVISLVVLYVVCRECTFNNNFVNLSSFSNLTIRNGTMPTLTNSTFAYVSHLQALSLRYCRIEHIEAETFQPLKKLIFLDLSSNPKLGFTELGRGLYGLRNSPIQCLKINMITHLTNVAPVNKDTFQYLTNTSLNELHVDGNIIAYSEKGALGRLPKTIQVVSVKYLLLSDIDGKEFFTDIGFLRSLRSIDITGVKQWIPGKDICYPWTYSVMPMLLLLPPRLEILKMANNKIFTDIGKHILLPQNVLKTIIVNDNSIMSVSGPITGADSVTYIDASRNSIYEFGSHFFSSNNSVKYLNVSGNNLGNCFSNDRNGDIFAKLTSVEVLDMSNNRITSLPISFGRGLIKIKYLTISNNLLFTFRVSLNHMTNLRHLDLSNNKLQLLPVNAQKNIDILNKTVINLKNNPLACSCQSLQFLQWVRIRHGRIQGLNNITCLLPNGIQVGLNDIDGTVSQLEKQCSSNVVLITVTVSSIMCVLVIVGVIAGYRNRWKLRYLYHVGRKGYQVLNEDDEVNYRYDAFVSYADGDRHFVKDKLIPELEQNSGLRLCIHHRDFLPGAVISENIVTSIQNSRKTLLVVSPGFLKSEWCSYEFNMALVDGISRKQNTIVMVLYKQVELKNVPKDLAVMLSNNSYLEYNTDLHGGVVFWNNLVESINTTQPLH